MAAKGDSKQGLVITMVFFILLSILLGVVAYYGYADQAQLENDKKKALADQKTMQGDRDFYRFQSMYLQAMAGQGSKDDVEELGLKRAEFDKKQLGINNKDRPKFEKIVESLDKKLGWKGGKPDTTFVNELNKRDEEIKGLALKVNDEAGKFTKVDAELGAKRRELDALREEYKGKLEELKKGGVQDLQKYVVKIDELQKEIDGLGQRREDLQKEIGLLQEKYDKLVKKLEKDIDELQLRLAKAQDKLPKTSDIDLNLPKGRIQEIDRTGQTPFINIGRADGVKPQLTFAIHGAGPDGRPMKEAKGTLEVLDVLGERLSQARLTSVKDPNRDPVMKGDYLFNPGWSPNMKQHVAIAGIVDLTGEGRRDSTNLMMRNLADFTRQLEGQNVVVDAYLDLKDNSIKGQITRQTDYLILGESPSHESSRLPRDGGEPKEEPKITPGSQASKMQQEAIRNGVTIISLKKFLALSGFRPPRTLHSEEPNYEFRKANVAAPSPLDRQRAVPGRPEDKLPANKDDKMPLPK